MSTHAKYVAALRWARYARDHGARFDVERKAAESIRFCLDRGARRFALPTKLTGTKPHAARVEQLAPLQELRLHVVRVGEGRGTPQVVAAGPAGVVGCIQDKHVRWLAPLVEQGAARCHVLQITGGTAEAPTRGVNVALSFRGRSADCPPQAAA